MQRPRPGSGRARLDAPSGPGLPSQLDIDVHAGPSLGNLRAALEGDDTRPPAPAPAPRGSSLASTLGGLALVGVFGAIGVTLAALWVARDRPPVDVVEEPPPMLAPTSGPAAAPAPAAIQPEPAPVVEEPPAPAPKAAPKAAAPKPKPKPAPPKAPASAVASLQVRGDAVVELQGEFGGFRAGTPLPPGRYQVFADFGEGLTDTGKVVTADAGDRIVVSCNPTEAVCMIIQ